MYIAYGADKFAERVLHIAARLQDDCADGATKLNQVVS